MNVTKAPVITNLQDHFLVATAALNGTFFDRSLIYICSHTPDGTMGVVVNKPMPLTFGAIASSMGIEEMMMANVRSPTIFQGGPVENNRGFVLHSRDYRLPGTCTLGPHTALSATHDIVTDIAKGSGPMAMNFCLGYAGWKAGQIENELHDSAWLVVPADPLLLFETSAADRYGRALSKLGLDVLSFHDEVGIA